MDIGRAINYNPKTFSDAELTEKFKAQSGHRGRSSGVEHNLAKVGVVGSNPIARSSLAAHRRLVADADLTRR